MNEIIFEKNKITGLTYAFTENGIELPVLDVTHPLFIRARLLGINGLKEILQETAWTIENVMENNPRYLTFTLGK